VSDVDLRAAPSPPVALPGELSVRVVVAAVAAGAALDLGVRSQVPNAVLVAGLLVVVGLLLDRERVESRSARGLAAFAVVPASFLALRASPWLALANLAAFGALVGGCVLHARSGSMLDTSVRRLLRRSVGACRRAIGVPRVVAGVLDPRRRGPATAQALRVGRAVVAAVPLLAVIVALLASGDALFARLLVPDVAPGPMIGHAVLVGLFSVGVLLTVAAAGGDGDDDVAAGRFGAVEVVTMLVLCAGVVGLFVVSQLVALTATGERLLASSGLTPAEYARSGFFQLCWASALLVAYLGLVRSLAAPGVMAQRPVRLLAGWVPVLALGLVAVSLRRMALYDQAFGLTMLRLAVVAAALWLGVVLILIAVRNLVAGSRPNWMFGAAGAAAVALVLAADLLDPEAFVVRHNLGRAAGGAEVDVAYLAGLSDDAVPAIAGSLRDPRYATLHPRLQAALRCKDESIGVARLNLAVARAAHQRADLCQAELRR
jgi:hypothetical protein